MQADTPKPKQQLSYSTNDEDFNHLSPGEVFDALAAEGELTAGRAYYEADFKNVEPRDAFDVDGLLDDADARINDELGEVYGNDFSNVGDAAKAELEALFLGWVERHVNLGRYWIIVGKSRQLVVTEEDVREHHD